MRWYLFAALVVLVFGWFTAPVQAELVSDEPVCSWIPTTEELRTEGRKGTTKRIVDWPRTMWAPYMYWQRSVTPYSIPSRYAPMVYPTTRPKRSVSRGFFHHSHR